jgi:hypothetical protein
VVWLWGKGKARQLDAMEEGDSSEGLMTQEEFDAYSDAVTDLMTQVIQPSVTSLSSGSDNHVRLIGTGTLIQIDGMCLILTCGQPR